MAVRSEAREENVEAFIFGSFVRRFGSQCGGFEASRRLKKPFLKAERTMNHLIFCDICGPEALPIPPEGELRDMDRQVEDLLDRFFENGEAWVLIQQASVLWANGTSSRGLQPGR
eukprot:symbB.v1.2.007886.t1/scaffold489.1/size197246/4